MKKILFTTAFSQASKSAWQYTLKLVKYSKAEISILHVSDVSVTPDMEGQVLQSIEEYVEDTNADLLVLKEHPKGFFQQLFDEDIIGEITKISKVPILIFNINAI